MRGLGRRLGMGIEGLAEIVIGKTEVGKNIQEMGETGRIKEVPDDKKSLIE